MESPQSKHPCWNSAHGCEFVAASSMKTLYHLQKDCEFHPLRCFKRVLVCRESPSSSSPPHAPYEKVGWDTQPQDQRENAKESRTGMESAYGILKNIERIVEDKRKEKNAKLDALSRKLDSYIRKQDDQQRKLNAKIVQQLEELRSDKPKVLSDVRVVRAVEL